MMLTGRLARRMGTGVTRSWSAAAAPGPSRAGGREVGVSQKVAVSAIALTLLMLRERGTG